tara:strand:- start:120 stop:422 length:303 start_codon:yes stop_codon:yes gene_type:complete
MATQISENTQLKLDLKTIGIIIAGAISLASMYFVMAADIEEAKQLPKAPVSEVEFKYKDEMIRKTIELTQKDVEAIKGDVESMKVTLEKLDERLYDLQRR